MSEFGLLHPAVLAMLIPLSAIIGAFYIKGQKIKAQQGLSKEDKEILLRIVKDNEEMRDRIENLEGIITSMDKELIGLKANNDTEANRKKVQNILDKMQSNL